MKLFKLDDRYSVVCEWKKTRTAFKHEASVLDNGTEVHKTKICYQNRTWESYEYQSVLHKAIDNYFTQPEAKNFRSVVDGTGKNGDGDQFKAVKLISAFGDITLKTQAEKNAWNKRMLSTVPGINFPDDFDSLPEKEQTKRLEGALKMLNKEE